MIGIYLGAYKAKHPNRTILYQDINGKRDIPGDMLKIDLTPYDYIIATPPCNYYSKARGNRCSKYSEETKHLLPGILKKLIKTNKPFIVENVRNAKKFAELGLFDLPVHIYFIGRHTYWTNVLLPNDLLQRHDFTQHGWVIKYEDMKNKDHQGGYNVHRVIESFIEQVEICDLKN